MKFTRVFLCLLFGLLAMLPAAYGQAVTGQITGRVVDPGNAVVVGAKVQLVNEVSQAVREFTADNTGAFTFPNVMPGSYTVRVTQQGFKTYEQKGITLGTQERAALGDLKLELGEVSTTVEVNAQAVRVATDSSDRSAVISLTQIEDTPLRGRNPLSLIMTLPGVQTLSGMDTRGWSGAGIPAVNGGQMGQTILNLDGVASQDSGNLNPGYLSPSIDAIGEVRLLVSNYTAEYGGRTGGQFNITVKSGNSNFHGGAYMYWRNEFFNANTWFNNKNGSKFDVDGKTLIPMSPRPRYRFWNPGGTIGGPLIIPGTNFNKSRTKLFFFFSYDYTGNTSTIDNTYTMPSALERQGDFSKTVTTAGVQIPIYDPSTPGIAYAGNVIRTGFSPAGQAMLNLFPFPDPAGLALDTTGGRRYNFRAILPQSRPNEDKILRIDYNLGSKWIVYARLMQDYQAVDGYAGTTGPQGGAWGQFPHSYHVQAAGAVGTVIYTINPNLINEFSWGANRGKQGNNPLDTISSTAVGGTKTYADNLLPLKDATTGAAIPLPRINKSSNDAQNLLPRVEFGLPSGFSAQIPGQGVNGAPTFGPDSRWPFFGTDLVQSITNKVTWVKGAHNVKAGIYIERMARNVAVYSQYNTAGTYYFGTDKANPQDTGYPYANAVIGSIFAYGDDNKKQTNHARYTQIEWFVQDTWKIGRRLTLDIGSRFHRVGDLYSAGATMGFFNEGQYSASQAGQLLYPACSGGGTGCSAANKIAVNLVNGNAFQFVRQGTFDTSSYAAGAIPWSGIKQYDSHFFNISPIQFGPRVGFAYDVFGNGKTAVRGGFGITPGRNWTVDNIGATGAGTGPLAAPPNFLAPIALYTSFASIAGAQGYFTPQNVLGGSQDEKIITTYNWSFGVQQDIGHGMIADVSYVGNNVRNGYGQSIDLNAVPPYTTWNPTDGLIAKYRDPTSSNANPASYSTNLVRSLVGYQGFASIPAWTYLRKANYNSLQVQLNRRTGRLQWNLNYTWSKQITYPNSTGYQFVPLAAGKDTPGRKQAVNFNFGYGLPSPSRFLGGNVVAKHALDGWRLAGNGAIFSGDPFGVSCSATNQPAGYWTGTPTGGIPFRCEMGNNPWLPAGQYPSATQDPKLQWSLNPANFTLPAIDSMGFGNTPPRLFFGPGAFNLDLSLAKDFRLGKEGRNLEFKAESFNTLNHFNPSNPNTSLSYNFVTGAQSNANFGVITGVQNDARRVVLSLRFRF